MVFDEFKYIIAESITRYLKECDVDEVRLTDITKNNDTKKTGILVMEKNESITPAIYLEDYFAGYQEGQDLEDILLDIAACFEESKQRGKSIYERDYNDLMDYEKIRDQIILRAVGLLNNQEYLEDKIYDVKKDMALVYFILLEKAESNLQTCAIHQGMLDSYGVSKNEISELAMENTQRLFPPTIKSMEDVLNEMILPDCQADHKSFEQSLCEMSQTGVGDIPCMLILSNEDCINGATSMFYPDILETITKELGTDVYVLPSSIHEVILVPKNGEIRENQLTNMVREVNATQVDDQEVLTNHTYEYCREVGELTIAGQEKVKEQEPVEVNRAARKNIRSR